MELGSWHFTGLGLVYILAKSFPIHRLIELHNNL